MTCAIRYASILMAKGEREHAVSMLHTVLTSMASHREFTFGAEAEVRAAALAVLGDTDAALAALETSFSAAKAWWWYDIERAPEFQALRANPRFQDLARQVRDNAAKQAALLAAMRRAGDIPNRPSADSSLRNHAPR
jgi:hypothetical protein